MSIARLSRDSKRQLGQFLTPSATVATIVDRLDLSGRETVLEPSFGHGAFIFGLVAAMRTRLSKEAFQQWVQTKVFGCEIDPAAYAKFLDEWHSRHLGPVPASLSNCDFFQWLPPGCEQDAALSRKRYFSQRLGFFDLIIGNPPFGGSIEPSIQDDLDSILGFRMGIKIKKETYAFFIVKCLDLLKPNGRLCFICSDTLLTIPTMRGLRNLLQHRCRINVEHVPGRFEETTQDMVLLKLEKTEEKPPSITVFGQPTEIEHVTATENLSWRVNGQWAKYFQGETLGDYMVGTSGMTTGNNELFVRKITEGRITEPYHFEFGAEKITIEKELQRARLGQISAAKTAMICQQERDGETQRVVVAKKLLSPLQVHLPSKDYRFYNKANSSLLYAPPEWVIFWRDDGEYVYTYKKTGNWYLHGVGGKNYFLREGLTWALIAPRFCMKYLPAGYVLDSGAPCAFLRPGVQHDELYFILGWTLTTICNQILKNVINHTRNIQSKDFERTPYPSWVSEQRKQQAIDYAKHLLHLAKGGRVFEYQDAEIRQLDSYYEFVPHCASPRTAFRPQQVELVLKESTVPYRTKHKPKRTTGRHDQHSRRKNKK
jgi:hypothetical protein